ncbi:hypothetical protein VTK56DRAFT_9318 [Thermocarpiscus australiensis]
MRRSTVQSCYWARTSPFAPNHPNRTGRSFLPCGLIDLYTSRANLINRTGFVIGSSARLRTVELCPMKHLLGLALLSGLNLARESSGW